MYFIISHSILHRMRNVSYKSCTANQNIFYVPYFIFIVPFIRSRGKNIVEPDRPEMAIRHMHRLQTHT